ncbi:MAG TPA: hypothetical protein VFY29_15075 [Terriglobia bacterium]|nr:hypothetical protein [Terriglobia bacterium]
MRWLLLIALAGIAVVETGAAPVLQEMPVRAVTRNAGDTVALTRKGDRVEAVITSPRGIGSATFQRSGERWPRLTLRLNLRGLESLRITSGKVTLGLSVSSLSGAERRLSLTRDGGKEEEIGRSSEYWTDIRAFDERGKPIVSLPPSGGWFELEVPVAILRNDTPALTLEWIDFYR